VVTSILVVDDEPDARYLLRYAFERAGYVVREAADGLAAIAAIKVSAPALVVTDMMMPVMDGMELIRQLRADPRTADIPILSVSGNYELAVGADLALDKFGDLSDLIPLVQALIEKRRDSR
jgi:two-component system, chemotaxis family, chemotaxis protein CheY